MRSSRTVGMFEHVASKCWQKDAETAEYTSIEGQRKE